METSQTHNGNFVVNLDSRVKLYTVILFVTASYFLPNSYALLYLYGIISLLYLAGKLFMGALKTMVVYVVFEALKHMAMLIPEEGIAGAIAYMVFFLQRTSVIFLMVGWMSAGLNVSRLIASFQNMKIPISVVIPIAVIFRFFPTVQSEFATIKDTMKLRGVGINTKNIFLHPIRTVEYTFVPLFIRSAKIADEISASAMTRGLGLKKKRSSHETVYFTMLDLLIAVIITGLLLPAFFLFNGV